MSDIMINFEKISKHFFGVCALQNVSLTLRRGKILGIIGQNGAGKSTLMNILGGVVIKDEGNMTIDGTKYEPHHPHDARMAGITFIHQELNLFPNISIEDNLFIEDFPKSGFIPFIDHKIMREKAKKILNTAQLTIPADRLVEDLSPGERQMVEIAKAIGTNSKIIIFDEPTTSLTAREREQLFKIIKQLQKKGETIIYISHILDEVMLLSDDILILRDGQVMATDSKNNFTMDRMITLMVGRNIKNLYPQKTSAPKKNIILSVKNIFQPGLIRNTGFDLNEGEILGIFGLMGSGRTELLRAIFGLDSFQSGDVTIHGIKMKKITPSKNIKMGMAFVTENRCEEGLLMDASIAENIALASLNRFIQKITGLILKASLYQKVKTVAELLKIKASSLDKQKAKSLSGGNQQKTIIAKWLITEPTIFIMDEPTRGIDVGTKYNIYSIIDDLAYQGSSIIFISSELEELIGMCDRILVMSRGEIFDQFERKDFNDKRILSAAFRQ